MIRQDPKLTRMWVRKPADLCRCCRSSPTMPPRNAATLNRAISINSAFNAGAPSPDGIRPCRYFLVLSGNRNPVAA